MTEPRNANGSDRKLPSSRQRARQARAAVLEAQRDRERLIEDALTAVFERQGLARAAQLAVEVADRDLAAAVARLVELGESVQVIASTMEVSQKAVQRLLKLAEEESGVGRQVGKIPAATGA